MLWIFRYSKINETHLEVYGITKWTPPIDMFNEVVKHI